MDKIEILSVELLDRHRPLVEELKRVAQQLQLEFGWHYLLDLVWILSHLGDVKGKVIMDAGAGTGVLQWYLAAQGATVLSVDRASRADLPWRFRRWVRVRGLRPTDLNPPLTALLNAGRKGGSLKARLGAMKQVVMRPSPPAPLPEGEGGMLSPPAPLPEGEGGILSPPAPLLESEGGMPSPQTPLLESEGEMPSPPASLLESEGGMPSPASPISQGEGGKPSPSSPIPQGVGGKPSPQTPLPEGEGRIPSPQTPLLGSEEGKPSPSSPIPQGVGGKPSPASPIPQGVGGKPSPASPIPQGEGSEPHPQPLSEKGGEIGFPFSLGSKGEGEVLIYNQDLSQLTDIPANTLDAVAALSALEHNPPHRLPLVVQELMRVLKPGGILLATLGASADQDWFHEPSQGWCYSEATLRRAFDLSPTAPSNYDRYAELMQALRECAELRDNLASFYFRSGENGMPWGKWDPQYQSVGVLRLKTKD